MTKDPGVPSLEQYARESSHRPTHKAWFDTLPQEIQDEVCAAWQNGVRGTPIVEWLQLKGFTDATKGKVNNYMQTRFGSEVGK